MSDNYEKRDRDMWDLLHARRRQTAMDEQDIPKPLADEEYDPNQTNIFSDPPLVRNSDRGYARQAADTIAPQLGKIQREVIEAYRQYGDMSSKTAEALPCFQSYGRSTIQKRISELKAVGILEYVEGAKEAVYRLVEGRVDNPLPRVQHERCPTCQRPF